ncbi:hypothetical protein GIB67_038125 [Kingdonia uniflora]|uniref:LOB domain-containing protein n=1 Tax=Kingdonia uniflora TaxID=39325 RepID=A0A7J7M1S1_9MAGN|nr:hypothetical protein GIB67_038125 [Kingdonia uniflora]
MANGACASCKYQRRKCQEDCFLAPYFPSDRCEDFQLVQKLFGVSNVMKMLKSVAVEQRSMAAESLVIEARMRRDRPLSEMYNIGAMENFGTGCSVSTAPLQQVQEIKPLSVVPYDLVMDPLHQNMNTENREGSEESCVASTAGDELLDGVPAKAPYDSITSTLHNNMNNKNCESSEESWYEDFIYSSFLAVSCALN